MFKKETVSHFWYQLKSNLRAERNPPFGQRRNPDERMVIAEFPKVYSLGPLFSDIHECNE